MAVINLFFWSMYICGDVRPKLSVFFKTSAWAEETWILGLSIFIFCLPAIEAIFHKMNHINW